MDPNRIGPVPSRSAGLMGGQTVDTGHSLQAAGDGAPDRDPTLSSAAAFTHPLPSHAQSLEGFALPPDDAIPVDPLDGCVKQLGELAKIEKTSDGFSDVQPTVFRTLKEMYIPPERLPEIADRSLALLAQGHLWPEELIQAGWWVVGARDDKLADRSLQWLKLAEAALKQPVSAPLASVAGDLLTQLDRTLHETSVGQALPLGPVRSEQWLELLGPSLLRRIDEFLSGPPDVEVGALMAEVFNRLCITLLRRRSSEDIVYSLGRACGALQARVPASPVDLLLDRTRLRYASLAQGDNQSWIAALLREVSAADHPQALAYFMSGLETAVPEMQPWSPELAQASRQQVIELLRRGANAQPPVQAQALNHWLDRIDAAWAARLAQVLPREDGSVTA